MPNKPSTQWSQSDYFNECLARVIANVHEIEDHGTEGKEISLLARSSQPDPKLAVASAIAQQLQKYMSEHPVKGYVFEFYLNPHQDRAGIKMRFFKTSL